MRRPLKPSGNSKWDRAIEQLRQYVMGFRIIDGACYRVKHHRDGQEIVFKSGGAPAVATPGELRRLLITAVAGDYVNAGSTDNAIGTTAVAKPDHLRESTWSGIGGIVNQGGGRRCLTSSFTTDAGAQKDISICQTIEPPYSGVIYAMRVDHTGVNHPTTGEEIKWIDVNVHARHWQYEVNQYQLCIDDEVWRAIFAAGAAVKET